PVEGSAAVKPKKLNILALNDPDWPAATWKLLAVSALTLKTVARSANVTKAKTRVLALFNVATPLSRDCVLDKTGLGALDDIFILLNI
ncbi:MAG: hypothetical protein ABIV48_09205, partial [Pyrinomonadaceae bacterium]